MKQLPPFFSFLIFAFLTLSPSTASAERLSVMPNLIILLADDLGYGELGCQGNKEIPTPHIDRIAHNGVRFTQGYVTAPNCSPSRAGLLTGKYGTRFGHEFNPTGAKNEEPGFGLPLSQKTLADSLQMAGYVNGLIGKWHLGHREKYLPLQNGFDEYAGLICSNDMWPVDYDGNPLTGKKKSYYPPMSFWEGNQPSEKIETLNHQGQLTKKITAKAVDFINKNKLQFKNENLKFSSKLKK